MEHFLSKIDDLCSTRANYEAVSVNGFWGKSLIRNKSGAAPYINFIPKKKRNSKLIWIVDHPKKNLNILNKNLSVKNKI